MLVSKIVSHAESVVAQNKKDRVRVLDRGACLKSKQHFSPAFQAAHQRACYTFEEAVKDSAE